MTSPEAYPGTICVGLLVIFERITVKSTPDFTFTTCDSAFILSWKVSWLFIALVIVCNGLFKAGNKLMNEVCKAM